MLGLVVVFVIGIYLVISLVVTIFAAHQADKRGKSPWLWGGLAAFAMYNLVFWDLIPTLVMHKYYCATEAGFWVYKTPEQWVRENPGVAETLSMSHLPEQYRVNSNNGNSGDSIYLLPDGTRLVARYRVDGALMLVEFRKPDGSGGYRINERFQYQSRESVASHAIGRTEQVLSDISTGQPLFREIHFWLGQGTASFVSGGSLEGWRRALVFDWFENSGQCGLAASPEMQFRQTENIFRLMGARK
jgi:hypothetical protein